MLRNRDIQNCISRIPWKIIVVITLFIYITGLLTAWLNPAQGAEVDIYASTPLYFWIALFITYIVGISIVLLYASHSLPEKLYRNLGILFLFLGAAALIGLTSIRGYYLMNLTSDTAYHFAWMREIFETGYFGKLQSNPYPVAHISYAEYSQITNLSAETIIRIVPHLGTIIFLIGTILLSSRLFSDKKIVLFTIIFSLLVPFGSVQIIGAGVVREPACLTFGYYFIPLLLYMILLFTTHEKSLLVIPVAVFTFFVTLIHPMTGTVVGVFIVSLLIVNILSKYVNTNSEEKKLINERLLILLGVCVFAFLIWHFALRIGRIASLIESILLMTGIGSNEITMGYVDKFNTATEYGYGITTYLRMASLPILSYIFIPIAGLYYLITKKYHDEVNNNLAAIIIFAGFLVVLTAMVAFGASGANTSRYMTFFAMCGILCSGYICSKLFHTDILKRTYVTKFLTVLLVVSVLVVSILSYYPSPYTVSQSRQNTFQEIQAAATLFPIMQQEHDKLAIYYSAIGSYATYLYGFEKRDTNQYGNTKYVTSEFNRVANLAVYHFGYDRYRNYGSEIVCPSYLLLSKGDVDYYLAYHPKLIPYRYTPTDYSHLYSDNSVLKYYDGGDITSYLIIP